MVLNRSNYMKSKLKHLIVSLLLHLSMIFKEKNLLKCKSLPPFFDIIESHYEVKDIPSASK